MRKLAVAVLAVALMAGAGTAWAQPQGFADPLALATSGAVVPFKTQDLAVLELLSPAGFNTSPALHFVFFNEACTRQDSVNLPVTSNDAEIVSLNALTLGASTGGLVGIGATPDDGFTVVALREPIWSRSYWFNVVGDFVRVFDQISVLYDLALGTGPCCPYVAGAGSPTWNPLDSAVGFYAPLEGTTFQTTLFLICPTSDVTGLGVAFPGNGAPPSFAWPSVNVADSLRGVVYDDDENPLRDISVECECLTEKSVLDLSAVYGDAAAAPNGTYTELIPIQSQTNYRFTGYLATQITDGQLAGGQLDAWRRPVRVGPAAGRRADRPVATGCDRSGGGARTYGAGGSGGVRALPPRRLTGVVPPVRWSQLSQLTTRRPGAGQATRGSRLACLRAGTAARVSGPQRVRSLAHTRTKTRS